MFAKNYHLYWIAGRANILCKYLIYMFFQFWAWLLRFFFCFFRSSSFFFFFFFFSFCDKKNWKSFLLHCTSICMSSKVCLKSLKPYFKLEILVFLSFMVSFLVDMFNEEVPFLTKKTSVVISETHFSRETIKV